MWHAARMQDFTRRTLRTWAVADAVYALLLTIVAAALIPWKTPVANVALLLYAAAFAAVGVGLWRGARWGWRLALSASGVGLLAGVAVVGGLLFSWAYLRS